MQRRALLPENRAGRCGPQLLAYAHGVQRACQSPHSSVSDLGAAIGSIRNHGFDGDGEWSVRQGEDREVVTRE